MACGAPTGGYCAIIPEDDLSPEWVTWLREQTLRSAACGEVPTWAFLASPVLPPPSLSCSTLLERLAWILDIHPEAQWAVCLFHGTALPQSGSKGTSRTTHAIRQGLGQDAIALARWDPRLASDPSAIVRRLSTDAKRGRVLVLEPRPNGSVRTFGSAWTPASARRRLAQWIRSRARSVIGLRLFRLAEDVVAGGVAVARQIARRFGEDPWLARRSTWSCRLPRSRVEVRPCVPADRIRILMAMHWLELGGAEKGAVDLIQRLSQDRYCVYVTTDVPSANSWENRVAPHAQEIWHLPTFLRRADAPRFFDHLITSRGINVLHIHHSAWAYESLSFLRRFHPHLAVLDTLHILELPPSPGGYPEWSAAQFEPFIDVHHVSSEFLRRFLRERWNVPDQKIRRIYTNVDSEFFDRDRVPAGQFREAWSIPSEAVVVAFTARFVSQKRPGDFLCMARHLLNRWRAEGERRELRFVMAGGGPLRASCERLAQRLGLFPLVIFPGEVEDMRKLYRDTDLVVLCSDNEGIAFVSYEALAMGVPLLATDVGAQGELLDLEQRVPLGPQLPKRLADAAWRMLRDEAYRQRLVERGLRRVRTYHRLTDAVRDMEQLYEELVKPQNPALLA